VEQADDVNWKGLLKEVINDAGYNSVVGLTKDDKPIRIHSTYEANIREFRYVVWFQEGVNEYNGHDFSEAITAALALCGGE
jgi:hypothetical protein